jgi:hypothetical protein
MVMRACQDLNDCTKETGDRRRPGPIILFAINFKTLAAPLYQMEDGGGRGGMMALPLLASDEPFQQTNFLCFCTLPERRTCNKFDIRKASAQQ